MSDFPVLKMNEMKKLIGKRVDVADGWGGSFGVLSEINEDSICVSGFWYKISLILKFQIEGKDYERGRKILVRSLWENEYNSIGRSFFNARLNRFVYDFKADATFDMPYDEWVNELNGKGEPYLLLDNSMPEVARLMYKERVAMMRLERFRAFYKKLCGFSTLDEVLDEFMSYPHLYLVND